MKPEEFRKLANIKFRLTFGCCAVFLLSLEACNKENLKATKQSDASQQLSQSTTIKLMSFAASFVTLSPATFTAANLSAITPGETVYLQPGTYNLDQSLINAWVAGNRSNVTFTRSGTTGEVIMNGNSFSIQPTVSFNADTNLTVQYISFVNLVPELHGCKSSTFDHLRVTGQRSADPANDAANNALNLNYSTNCTVSNSYIRWDYSGRNGKAIKIFAGDGNRIINNSLAGLLRGGIDCATGKNLTVSGGNIARGTTTGIEDHGIYMHDIINGKVVGVHITGWTPDAAGGSLKLKNDSIIEVANNTFNTSGLLLRIDVNDPFHPIDNIWIHNNTINSTDGINQYTPAVNAKSIVIENNSLTTGTISLNTAAADINLFCPLANKAGGVYNNGTHTSLQLTAGINQSGNYTN